MSSQPAVKLSLIIPCLNKEDPKLKELLRSIDAQDFPKEELEILIITEGTSESAKAIGIRRAKGEVIGILATDNELSNSRDLTGFYTFAMEKGSCYPAYYSPVKGDNLLNRYFALIGGNDPLSFYMGKNDRWPWHEGESRPKPGLSIGDNGFFIRKELIEKTDLDNYYHIDNANEAVWPEGRIVTIDRHIWHKTGGNIFKFFAKRYRYGIQHAFNKNRRWHLVDFRQPKDVMRLIWFIVASLTVVHPLLTSVKGYRKIQDVAWLLHPAVCIMTVFVYGALVLRVLLNQLYQSLFAPLIAQRA